MLYSIPFLFVLISEKPWFFILFCTAVAALYSFVLYSKNKLGLNKKTLFFLSILRFLLVFFLAFFLLEPLLKAVNRTVEKPIVVFAQDNSESIVKTKDSVFYKQEYPQKLNQLINDLKADFDVRLVSFAQEVSTEFNATYNGKQTDISNVLDFIHTNFYNSNLGATVLLSDGIYNKGANPLFLTKKQKSAIYTVALGDTLVRKDLALKKINYNNTVYSGNTFPLQVNIEASECAKSTINLIVKEDSTVVYSKPVNISSNTFFSALNIELQAKGIGKKHYKIIATQLSDEINVNNNSKDIYIDVIDNKQKILLLAERPHPDISAIASSINKSDNYEVEVELLSNFSRSLSPYNLIVLHQLPNTSSAIKNILLAIKNSNTPILFINPSYTSAEIQSILSVQQSGQKTNEAEPVLNPNFNLFTVSNELKNLIADFSPIQVPFGSYKVGSGANALITQKIASIETVNPIIVFSELSAGQKVGVYVGENFWKWKMKDYEKNKNHNQFNELILKTIQYLTIKKDKSIFRINHKNVFDENEAIEFNAELYNDSYELINEPDILLEIKNSSNEKSSFTFSKISNYYQLNIGVLPVGDYTYAATVKIADKTLVKEGKFYVKPLQIESASLLADHHLLHTLAKTNNGEMFYPQQLEKLKEVLMAKEDIKTISHQQQALTDLINLKLFFFLLVFLLSAEWFVRKWNGGY